MLNRSKLPKRETTHDAFVIWTFSTTWVVEIPCRNSAHSDGTKNNCWTKAYNWFKLWIQHIKFYSNYGSYLIKFYSNYGSKRCFNCWIRYTLNQRVAPTGPGGMACGRASGHRQGLRDGRPGSARHQPVATKRWGSKKVRKMMFWNVFETCCLKPVVWLIFELRDVFRMSLTRKLETCGEVWKWLWISTCCDRSGTKMIKCVWVFVCFFSNCKDVKKVSWNCSQSVCEHQWLLYMTIPTLPATCAGKLGLDAAKAELHRSGERSKAGAMNQSRG